MPPLTPANVFGGQWTLKKCSPCSQNRGVYGGPLDRFTVYNAEIFLWAPLTYSHHISRNGDEIKKK